MYYFSFVYFYDNDLYIGVHNRRVPHFFIDFMDFALTVLAEYICMRHADVRSQKYFFVPSIRSQFVV